MMNRQMPPFAQGVDAKSREDAAVLGLLVVLLRSLRGWNQEQAAKASGVHKSQLSLYELWKAMPTEATLKRLASAAGVTWAEVQTALPALRALYRAVVSPLGELHIPRSETLASDIGSAASLTFLRDVQPFLQERLPALNSLDAPEPVATAARLGDDRMALGLLIILLRSLRHWTQEELSRASGIGRRRISDYERGKILPRRKKLEKLAGAVGTELRDVQKTLPVLARLSRAASKPGSLASEIGRSAAEVFLLEVESFVGEACPCLAGLAERQEARRQAELRVNELLGWPPDKRWQIVQELAAYRTWAVAERMAVASAKRASDDAAEALDIARLAVRMAELTEGGALWKARVGGICWGFLANSIRVKGDFPASDKAFVCSDRLFEAGAPADPGLIFDGTRLLDLKASLRRSQGRFPESLGLLDEALAASRSPEEKAHILLVRSTTLEQMGDWRGAIEALEEARPLVKKGGDLRSLFGLEFNLSASLADAGEYEEAARLLPDVQRLAGQLGNGLDKVRLLWLRARIFEGFGKLDEAIYALEQVREELATREIAFDTARACLDLAALYLQQGRTAEVKRLADQMVEIFRAQQVPREAMAAVLVFHKAVEQERATVELARRLSDYLRRAQHEPELQFKG